MACCVDCCPLFDLLTHMLIPPIRLCKYFSEHLSTDERHALEGEIVRKCLTRTDKQCSFYEHRQYKIVYRRYASLFFMVGVDEEENELGTLEFIHAFVEILDRHFGQVCELDIMNEPEMVHYVLDEMLLNGCIVDTNLTNILEPVRLLETVEQK